MVNDHGVCPAEANCKLGTGNGGETGSCCCCCIFQAVLAHDKSSLERETECRMGASAITTTFLLFVLLLLLLLEAVGVVVEMLISPKESSDARAWFNNCAMSSSSTFVGETVGSTRLTSPITSKTFKNFHQNTMRCGASYLCAMLQTVSTPTPSVNSIVLTLHQNSLQ